MKADWREHLDDFLRSRNGNRQLPAPWFAEELILDEDCDGEHDGSLDGHRAQVFPHHVPAERVFKSVLPFEKEHTVNQYYTMPFYVTNKALSTSSDGDL